jgi:hypothetical protein
MKRVHVNSVADDRHGQVALEGRPSERLPDNRLYIKENGTIVDPREGGSLSQLDGGEIEFSRKTWGNE